ncbi:sterol desaturase family [Aspergillus heteromorphus CBS 117.55]|uniref:Sterol desaturase family n=1 Tax=Aspergillus heteromorphus CBS 117.55 TaxID=1448321 RepID=A0A317WTW5_9EURO|nr:sterol desaturase family [Aspergillus heteromorphus CBS 117.55]PWY89769.1 sterol desaturase family [Aspergillus heteromorphus CBS 117.55]
MTSVFAVPFLALFVLPSIASYSTTLNVIFFYMTWTTLILSHSPFKVELIGTIAVRLVFYVLPSLLFFLFDIFTPSAAVVLKAQGEFGLPAGSKRSKIRLQDFKVAGWSLFNLALGIAVQATIETIRIAYFRTRSALRVTFRVPMPWDTVIDLIIVFAAREALSYTIHRHVLHSKKDFLRRHVAQYHESWYHSLRAPYPLTAHYDHPISYLIGNVFPTLIPAAVFRLHMVTYAIYLLLVSLEETFAFSGYSVMPTDFFLGRIARRTEMHLHRRGEGNFGPWGVMDWMFRTGVGEDEEEAIDQEVIALDEGPGGATGSWPSSSPSTTAAAAARVPLPESERESERFEEKVEHAIEKHARKRQRQHRLRRTVQSD